MRVALGEEEDDDSYRPSLFVDDGQKSFDLPSTLPKFSSRRLTEAERQQLEGYEALIKEAMEYCGKATEGQTWSEVAATAEE